MSTHRTVQALVETWLHDGFGATADVESMLDKIRTGVAKTPQRRQRRLLRSVLRRRSAGTPAAVSGEPQAAVGRTVPTFGITTIAMVGVIAVLIGSALLMARPFERQADHIPGEAGMFSPAGGYPMMNHTASLLSDGRVLVVGGGMIGGTPIAALWDPTTTSFGAAGSLAEGRAGHTATPLPDGRVLVVGGCCAGYTDVSGRNTAEIWDPATGSFAATGSLAAGRAGHTATLLSDGRVLVVGGAEADEDGEPSHPAEVWDPQTGAFEPAGMLTVARTDHTATLLPDGRVLVVGGATGYHADPVGSAEVWDPQTGSFEDAGLLTEARGSHTATLLDDGRVLVVGGSAGYEAHTIGSVELWDPATVSFTPVGSLGEARAAHTATLLPDGRVLVIGGAGEQAESRVASAELWDPVSSSFESAGSLVESRFAHTATLLPDGSVLVIGGEGEPSCGWDRCVTGFALLAEVWAPS